MMTTISRFKVLCTSALILSSSVANFTSPQALAAQNDTVKLSKKKKDEHSPLPSYKLVPFENSPNGPTPGQVWKLKDDIIISSLENSYYLTSRKIGLIDNQLFCHLNLARAYSKKRVIRAGRQLTLGSVKIDDIIAPVPDSTGFRYNFVWTANIVDDPTIESISCSSKTIHNDGFNSHYSKEPHKAREYFEASLPHLWYGPADEDQSTFADFFEFYTIEAEEEEEEIIEASLSRVARRLNDLQNARKQDADTRVFHSQKRKPEANTSIQTASHPSSVSVSAK